MGVVESVRSFFGGASASGGVVGPVGELIAATRAQQPEGYAAQVARANAYLTGEAAGYVRAALQRSFPESAQHMEIAELKLYRRVILEQSRVFAGDGKYELVRDDEVVEEAGGAKWLDVLRDAHWSRKSVEINRATTANRVLFVRVSWDDARGCVVLTQFTPDRAFLALSDTVRDVDTAPEIAVELESVVAEGKKRRRFERWTVGEEPLFEVVDERGEVIRSGPNEYRGPDGLITDAAPFLPFVVFRATDPDWGWWAMPDQALLAAAETVNTDLANSRFVGRLNAHGQWVAKQTAPDGEGVQPWSGRLARGPEKIMKAPRGWDLTHISQDAPLVELDAQTRSFVDMVTTAEQLPPGSVLASSRQMPSGVALQIERAPLAEFRQDQIEIFRPSVERLLDVVRMVWNAHQPDNSTRFLGCRPRWTPGAVRAPVTNEEQARVDEAEVRLGVTSPARLLMRKDPTLTLDAAKALAQEIADENRARTAGSLADFGRRIAAGADVDANQTDAQNP